MLPFKRMEFRQAQAKAIANRRLGLPPKPAPQKPKPPMSVAKIAPPESSVKTAPDYSDEYRLLPYITPYAQRDTSIDVSGIVEAIKDIKPSTPVTYEFAMKRDSKGVLTGVIATPVIESYE
jgi:hypothetical protein